MTPTLLPLLAQAGGFESVPASHPPVVHLHFADDTGAAFVLPLREDQLPALQHRIAAHMTAQTRTAIAAGDEALPGSG